MIRSLLLWRPYPILLSQVIESLAALPVWCRAVRGHTPGRIGQEGTAVPGGYPNDWTPKPTKELCCIGILVCVNATTYSPDALNVHPDLGLGYGIPLPTDQWCLMRRQTRGTERRCTEGSSQRTSEARYFRGHRITMKKTNILTLPVSTSAWRGKRGHAHHHPAKLIAEHQASA